MGARGRSAGAKAHGPPQAARQGPEARHARYERVSARRCGAHDTALLSYAVAWDLRRRGRGKP
jgi:hypothetical protein